jgi:hypothetical protein
VNIRSRKLTTAAAVLAALIGSVQFADAACTRHIYNNSNKPWTFSLGWSGPPPGPADFYGCDYNQDHDICKVMPQQTATIAFTGGVAATNMNITDSNGVRRSFDYDNTSVAAIFRGECQYVQHDGGTGAVSVNDPANGDFSIGGDNW